MCQNYLGRSAHCGSKCCSYFHICKDFIANGNCSKRANCIRNHGFRDRHNKKLASDYFPDVKLTEEQLRQLIKSSTPQVCMDYNERKCFGSGLQCKKIHVCKNYVFGNCNGNCHLLHERGLRTPETKEILAWLKVRENTNAKNLLWTLLTCCNDVKTHDDDVFEEAERIPEACIWDVDDKSDECLPVLDPYCINASSIENHICMKFLLKQCTEESSCADHHCPMPYQWIYMADSNWHMFKESENMNLEKCFCDENLEDNQLVYLSLNCSSFSGSDASSPRWLRVDFSLMEVHLSNMRFQLKRLSTESAVHVPECPLATKWRWLVKGPDGKLKEYDQESQMNSSGFPLPNWGPQQDSKNTRSSAIEKQYLEGHSTHDYEIGQRWRIYFKEKPMYQRTVRPSVSNKEEVVRRPLFISQEDFETIRCKPCVLPQPDTRQLPSTWTKMAECQDHLLVQLPSNSKEYQEIESSFLTHMRDKLVTMCSIDRIQNPFLWEKYTRKKNQMKRMAATRNNDPEHIVDERLLFHATPRRSI